MNFSIAACIDSKRGIGKTGKLPWDIPEDLKHFNRITSSTTYVFGPEAKTNWNSAVIMDKNTWLSLPENSRPLPKRLNIVLTSDKELSLPEGVLRFDSLDLSLNHLLELDMEKVFVIGGESLYQEAILDERCEKLYITCLKQDFECDKFFPEIPECFSFSEIAPVYATKDKGIEYAFIL